MKFGNWGKKSFGGRGESCSIIFRHFRRILTLNNLVLELIADLERALGGEYIYDRSFLQSSVAGIIGNGRQVIYHLNAMVDDRHIGLYDRFTDTGDQLNDILAGGPGPYGPLLLLDWGILHRDLVHLAGGKGASLGELANSLKIPTPHGFVVSTTGYRRFMEVNNLYVQIDEIMRDTLDPGEQARRIGPLFEAAVMPADLLRAIKNALKKVKHSGGPLEFAVRSSGVGEDGERSFAGQFQSVLGVMPREVAEAIVRVMASRFSERLLRYLGPEANAEEVPMAVVVQPMVKAVAAGVLYTRDPGDSAAESMVVSAVGGRGESLVSGHQSGDKLVLDRSAPFHPRSSRLEPTLDIGPAITGASGHLRRGSGMATLSVLRRLAEYGLLLEKRFESPQDIEWCIDAGGALNILQSRPLRLRRTAGDRELRNRLAQEMKDLPVLLAGKGEVCQLGQASGRVIHVDDEYPVESFPVGAIAVSRFASPRLAGIVKRAGAIITDVGSPTGHLATITREYRTPAIFGAGTATRLLEEGALVVVDVEERTVYRGHLELPADLAVDGDFEELGGNTEASLLRRLLRLIAPLNLTDPAAPEFHEKNCRTIHDFLRFSHEKAVEAMISFHVSGRMSGGSSAPLLEAEIPLRIRLIDIGGGLSGPETGGKVRIAQVTSHPLKSLLRGLLNDRVWDREPALFGIRDFLSGMSKPLSMLSNAPQYSGENLAIVAEDYCNLSLRLGYHFNIIDTYLSDDPDDNYIYFRFVGGFADPVKRVRRAALIDQILTALYFKVERKKDLVMAKVKMLERRHMESTLVRLGMLIAFTRQLDVKMADESTVDRFFGDFLGQIRREGGAGNNVV